MGGLHGELQEHGDIHRKYCNIPGTRDDVLGTEDEDRQHAQKRYCLVERHQGCREHIGLGLCLLVARELILEEMVTHLFKAEDAVGQRSFCPVESRGRHGRDFLLRRCHGACHGTLEPCRQDIGDRREDECKERDAHILRKQHDKVADHDHTGIEELGRELAHALDAVIHIGERLGHGLAALGFGLCNLAGKEIAVERLLHAAVHIVCEPAYIEALECPHALHEDDGQDIEEAEPKHRGGIRETLEDICQALCHEALEPGTQDHADVVEDACDRDDEKRLPLITEIREDRGLLVSCSDAQRYRLPNDKN